MGCGYVTCGITRLPINNDEECVMVDFTECPLQPGQMFDESRRVKITQILKGTYNDYGSLNEIKEDHDTTVDTYRIFFLKEVWDKVSQLYPRTLTKTEEEIVRLNRDGNPLEYFSKDSSIDFQAYDELKRTQDRLMYYGEFVEEWLSVKYFMDQNRLNLDSWFNGYTQDSNLVANLDLNKITRSVIDKRIAEYNEEIDDFDEDDREVFCYEITHPALQWKPRSYAEQLKEKYSL